MIKALALPILFTMALLSPWIVLFFMLAVDLPGSTLEFLGYVITDACLIFCFFDMICNIKWVRKLCS